ncbi:hypothetical protein IHO40_05210 [Wolbachia endosymbiont of Mansonella ozzardi]|uniref:hypothetical protein n=1 Tax=Wolbachia endosymbiont of Mansonella ozzardi TaxID=137464 RepID=UPI001CE04E8D|nr:hypothetical protein [Wolbachia endosymbiont of Mansonella ozzardi]MCA4775448.1 hypothetical protein [Wolbachia endosymbiont of Mansonella ozzardi]
MRLLTLTIEIAPDTGSIGNKKENFSIVLPISEKHGEALKNKRQENRNKIVLFTVPYVQWSNCGWGIGKIWLCQYSKLETMNFHCSSGGVIAIAGACVILRKIRK